MGAMALNEHDPSGPSIVGELRAATAPLTPTEEAAHVAGEILLAVQQAVLTGDHVGYAAALSEIPGIPERHRMHQAKLRSIERILLPGQELSPAVLARLMGAALDALIDWLEDTPAEPTLLGYAGVLATELGAYRPAEQIFAAALRLDPARTDLEDSRRAARDRRKAGASVIGLPPEVRAAIAQWQRQLERIAGRAKPATGLRMSLCMIVRDEEEMLPRCLEAVKDGVDEIIIVDTGSRDRTVEIARSYGATVLFHEWTGNFSEARNIGLDAATGDWLLWLDADEVFVGDDALRLRALCGKTWRECYRIDITHHLGDADDGDRAMHSSWRICRNRPEYRFQGRIHEQIGHTFPGFLLEERFEHTDLRMDHFGYLGAVRVDRGKTDRNLTLILSQLEEGDDSAFVHFNLASEYSALPDAASQLKALEHFRIAYHKVTDNLDFKIQGFLPSLVLRFVRSLRQHEEWAEMDEACELIHRHFPNFTDVWFEQAMAAFERAEYDGARDLFSRCLEMGDAPALYSPTVGCGSYLAQLKLADCDLAEGDLAAAIPQLEQVRREHPEYLGVIDPLTRVLLAHGEAPDAVLTRLTAGDDLSPSGWFMVGVNFQEHGFLPQAEAAFRGALERRPTFDQARVALADGLLLRGDIAGSLEQVEQVPADVRVGGAAVRTALFARLAAEDPSLDAGLAPLLDQLEASNLDLEEQQVLRAWAARRRGTPAPDLSLAHVPQFSPLMDAALRLGAADAFSELVGLLGETGITRRQHHELVAMTLLVRGLPELAADQWIEAVQHCGPDADAYAGLAEVARMQGLTDDAVTLAEEALGLDGSHALAQRVLEAAHA